MYRNHIISKTLSRKMYIVAGGSKAQVIKSTFWGCEFKPHKCLMFVDKSEVVPPNIKQSTLDDLSSPNLSTNDKI